MSLADLLNQSTVIYPGTTDGYMRKMDADRNLKALAPDMARLLIDMAALVVDQGKLIDFDATPNLSERYGALLARFAALDADRVEAELARLREHEQEAKNLGYEGMRERALTAERDLARLQDGVRRIAYVMDAWAADARALLADTPDHAPPDPR